MTEPHAQASRGVPTSAVRSAIVWVDFMLGWLGPWRRAARRGLILLERPWLDQAVDPYRYRIAKSLTPWLCVVGRLVRRADVAVCLSGDPSAVHRRKPEIGEHEVARQQEAWERLVGSAGRRSIRLDSVSMDPDDLATELLQRTAPPMAVAEHWVHPVGYPKRLDLRATSAPLPRSALNIYPPQKRVAVLRERIGRNALHLGVCAQARPPSV